MFSNPGCRRTFVYTDETYLKHIDTAFFRLVYFHGPAGPMCCLYKNFHATGRKTSPGNEFSNSVFNDDAFCYCWFYWLSLVEGK